VRLARYRSARDRSVWVGLVEGDVVTPVAAGEGRAGQDALLAFAMGRPAVPEAVGEPEALERVTLLAPVPEPPSIRDFYAFEAHVATARRSRGLEMEPDWYELPVFYFSNPASVLGPGDEVVPPAGTGELDYELEARNQQHFADFYRGHPFIHVPDVLPAFSGRHVITSELVDGSTWQEVLTWSQEQRDLAGETLFRFVFRSLYGMHAFNGDPHPGNYLFHGDGRVTFLDFGLVKHFRDDEMATFIGMVKAAAVDHDAAKFRSIVEGAGMLRAGCPSPDPEIGEYFSQFYESVRHDRVVTWSSEYSSRIVRHTFDRSSPIAQYATVPRAFVFIQRINLGLYALLGELRATGNYRRIAEELWPFVGGPPSTPMAHAEQEWLRTPTC